MFKNIQKALDRPGKYGIIYMTKILRKAWVEIMKKIMRIIALALIIATVGCLLASCGALSGTYKSITGTTYEFKGSKVIINYFGFDTGVEGTYKINGDKIKFEFKTDGIESDTLKGIISDIGKIEHSFEKGDGYIKIDGIKYEKQ